ncbi:MAG: hypothetical protein GAK30_01564 [Paracidovorax wautersii]|uniref:Uncharacterized protein n=1 Tax=Paracidovorax wautersii TaxID=1177982 RepID=A0A7V8FPQ9_9BURK|nr:MAG: hypothetical protein GAK30_01564 [Paracidovorax wautersii]
MRSGAAVAAGPPRGQHALQRQQGRHRQVPGRDVHLPRWVGECKQEELPGLHWRHSRRIVARHGAGGAGAGPIGGRRQWLFVPRGRVLRGATGWALLLYGFGRKELFAEVVGLQQASPAQLLARGLAPTEPAGFGELFLRGGRGAGGRARAGAEAVFPGVLLLQEFTGNSPFWCVSTVPGAGNFRREYFWEFFAAWICVNQSESSVSSWPSTSSSCMVSRVIWVV